METNKIGFFRRIFLAVTDFRIYPYVLKERFFKAFGYFIKLVLLCTALLSIYAMTLTEEFISDGIKTLEKKLPDFAIVSGEMIFSGDASVDVNSYITVVMKNDIAEKVSLSQFTADRMFFVATKDKLKIGNSISEESVQEIPYSAFPNTTKAEMLDNVSKLSNDFVSKIMLYCFIFITFLTYVLLNRTFSLFMYLLILMICNSLFVVKLKLRDMIKLTIYISTLPMLLETFAITVGGKYTNTAEFITFLIAGVYAFYALRAIRLNDILTKTAGLTPEEKIENAIKNAQEELEKQLKDIEEKAQKEDKTQNEEKIQDEDKTTDEAKNDDDNEKQ